jgi:Flp pilus assembly pilin Flp
MIERACAAFDRLVRTDDGQDLVEYAMLVVLIAVAAVLAVGTLGNTINSVFWQTIAGQSF